MRFLVTFTPLTLFLFLFAWTVVAAFVGPLVAALIVGALVAYARYVAKHGGLDLW